MTRRSVRPSYRESRLTSEEAVQHGISTTLSPISARAYFESGGLALAGSFVSYAAAVPALAVEATAIGATGAAIGASAFIISGAAAIAMITLGSYTLISGKNPLSSDQKSEIDAITNLYGQFAFTISASFSSKYDSSIFAAKTAKAASDLLKFSVSTYDFASTSRKLAALDMLLGLKDTQEAAGYLGTDFKKDFDKFLVDSETMSLFDKPNHTPTSSAFPDRLDLGDRPHLGTLDSGSDIDEVLDED
ncbi:hypothetical protein D3C77_449380 [compost metagenome]